MEKAQEEPKQEKDLLNKKRERDGNKQKKPKKKIINFITGNENKYKEISSILKEAIPDLEVNQVKADIPELQGKPEEIVKGKLDFALNTKAKGHPIIVDDTSLCLNSYKGLPGPYIKSFVEAIGNEGIYKMACAFEDKTAYAQAILGLQKNKKDGPHLFIGKVEGEIVSPKGTNNFGNNGWDPVFLPKGESKTYAEMTDTEKNKISHRSKALAQLIEYLKAHPEIF